MSSFICADLGASSTRYCSDNGIIKWIPNNICIIEEETVTRLEKWGSPSFEESIKQSLDVTITKIDGAESEYFPVRALIGDIAMRYSSSNLRPNSMASKHRQKINYISAITSMAVNRLTNNVLEDDIDFYVALPPVEAKPAEDYVAEQLLGTFKVKFNMLDKELTLRIKSVNCYAESYMATTSYFFNIDGSLNREHADFLIGRILSIDIGASTTDLAIVQKKFVENTGQTYKIGGNVVRDIVANYIQQEFGYEADNTTAEKVVVEGRVQAGNAYIDFSKFVIKAKEEFATQIVNSLDTYFSKIKMPLQSIRAIVVSGGGSMPGAYTTENGEVIKTSESMSYFIAEKLKDICGTIEVVHIDDEPRLANIKGLFIKASLDSFVRENKKAEGTNTKA